MFLSGRGRRLGDERGFSLIEGLVAGVIVLIGLLGSISIFESSGHESATGERQQIAAEQALAELERMRDLPYDQLATPTGTWPSSNQPGDPTARVSGTPASFATSDDGAEELAIAAAGGVAPYSEVEVGTGSKTMTLGIYRFVSWRDENCPILDLTQLTGNLEGLLDQLEDANALIDGLLGSGGLITGLLDVLLGGLNPLLGPLNIVEDLLGEVESLLASRAANLTDLIEQLDGLEIDPCDLDLETLAILENTAVFSAINPALEQLDQALDVYDNSCLPILHICTGSRQPVLNAITNLQNVLDPDQLGADIDALIEALDSIQVGDHPYNTKRLTVAVVLEPRTSTGPSKPVWATSIASDPNAGLLSG